MSNDTRIAVDVAKAVCEIEGDRGYQGCDRKDDLYAYWYWPSST